MSWRSPDDNVQLALSAGNIEVRSRPPTCSGTAPGRESSATNNYAEVSPQTQVSCVGPLPPPHPPTTHSSRPCLRSTPIPILPSAGAWPERSSPVTHFIHHTHARNPPPILFLPDTVALGVARGHEPPSLHLPSIQTHSYPAITVVACPHIHIYWAVYCIFVSPTPFPGCQDAAVSVVKGFRGAGVGDTLLLERKLLRRVQAC